MKPLLLTTLIMALGVGAHAEIFRPPLASGRGFPRQTWPYFSSGQGYPRADRGPFPGSFSRWHDQGIFLGAKTGFFPGCDLFDDWYLWPTDEPVLSTDGFCQVSSLPLVSQPRVILAGDGLHDARSPEQLRAIFGAQAEALIQHN